MPNVRGRYDAVVNEQAFVAETDDEAWNWAHAHHSDDDGAIVLLVPATEVGESIVRKLVLGSRHFLPFAGVDQSIDSFGILAGDVATFCNPICATKLEGKSAQTLFALQIAG